MSDQISIETWRKNGMKLVFTNGCFDLLHPGHVQYLNKAANLGDKLIVGLNSDDSVRSIKGKGRPVHDELFRKSMLLALSSVDLVMVFSEDTPIKLIQMVKPDLLVKGGDYDIEGVVGAPFVQSYGGEVRILPFLKGYSTSDIINKIIASRNADHS